MGITLIPAVSIACSSKSHKSCCQKPLAKESIQKDCCKKNKNAKKTSHDDCNGKCGDSSCQCPSSNSNTTIPNLFQINGIHFKFSGEELNFSTVEAYLTSGFISIWLPPKIG